LAINLTGKNILQIFQKDKYDLDDEVGKLVTKALLKVIDL